MSSLLSYHIFTFFISKFFENFKFRRNFLKFTAGMGYRLVAVSEKFGGNRRLPTGKVNPGTGSTGFVFTILLVPRSSHTVLCFAGDQAVRSGPHAGGGREMCVRLSAALLDGDRDRDRRRRGTDYGDEAWGHRLEMEM